MSIYLYITNTYPGEVRRGGGPGPHPDKHITMTVVGEEDTARVKALLQPIIDEQKAKSAEYVPNIADMFR